jgi:hypothetical protein
MGYNPTAAGCRSSGREMSGEDFIALLGQREILLGEASFIMRGKLQRHLVKTNLDIRMVIHFLRLPGDPVDKIDAL